MGFRASEGQRFGFRVFWREKSSGDSCASLETCEVYVFPSYYPIAAREWHVRAGFRARGFGCRVLGSGFWVQGFGVRVLVLGFWV